MKYTDDKEQVVVLNDGNIAASLDGKTVTGHEILSNGVPSFDMVSGLYSSLSTYDEALSTYIRSKVEVSCEALSTAVRVLSAGLSADIESLSASLSSTIDAKDDVLQGQINAVSSDISFLSGEHDWLSASLSADIDTKDAALQSKVTYLSSSLSNVIKVRELQYNETIDIDAIAAEFHMPKWNTNDVIIVKKHLHDIVGDPALDSQLEFTAFVYDADVDSCWKAMDGTYSAENVIFTHDFSLYGDYTQVGNIKIADKTLPAKGKSVDRLFNDIFDTTIQPKLGASPTTTTALTNAGQLEVGTPVTPSYKLTYAQGKYQQPWNGTTVNDGTAAKMYTATDTAGGSKPASTSSSGTFSEFTVIDTTDYHVNGYTTYGDGAIAKDNKGNPSSPVVQRLGGNTATTSSSSIVGFRYLYIGSIADDVPVTEEVIKSLTKFKSGAMTKILKKTGGDVPLVDGAKKVIVAIPTGTTAADKTARKLSEVLLLSASSTPITDSYFEQEQVEVSGATAGANKKAYRVYVYQPASIDMGEEHSIKIA